MRTYTHAYMHAYIHTYVHTYTHTHTYTYIHAYTHTYIHTYIHICTHIITPNPGDVQGDRAAPAKALKLLDRMRAAGVVPNAHAFGAAVRSKVDEFVPQTRHVNF